MTQPSQDVTAEQLAEMSVTGKSYELINGELRMMSPAGARHGRIAARLLRRIGNYVEQHELGETFAAETGFILARDPDTVRAPDVAYVSAARMRQYEDESGYMPLAPDLVVEVVSPNDTFSQVEEKTLAWLGAGVSVVLVVDPDTRTLRAYRDQTTIRVLYEPDELELPDVVPGFKLSIGQLFE